MIASAGRTSTLDEAYDDGRGGGVRPSDILDNAFVIVEDGGGGARCLLDLCMFAGRRHQEGERRRRQGKLEAFAPAHGLRFERERAAAAAAASGAPAPARPEPNVRISRRSAPPPRALATRRRSRRWRRRTRRRRAPLAAGFHEGATCSRSRPSAALRARRRADVDIDDGVRVPARVARARSRERACSPAPLLSLTRAPPPRAQCARSVETGEPVLSPICTASSTVDRAPDGLTAHAPRAAPAARRDRAARNGVGGDCVLWGIARGPPPRPRRARRHSSIGSGTRAPARHATRRARCTRPQNHIMVLWWPVLVQPSGRYAG